MPDDTNVYCQTERTPVHVQTLPLCRLSGRGIIRESHLGNHPWRRGPGRARGGGHGRDGGGARPPGRRQHRARPGLAELRRLVGEGHARHTATRPHRTRSSTATTARRRRRSRTTTTSSTTTIDQHDDYQLDHDHDDDDDHAAVRSRADRDHDVHDRRRHDIDDARRPRVHDEHQPVVVDDNEHHRAAVHLDDPGDPGHAGPDDDLDRAGRHVSASFPSPEARCSRRSSAARACSAGRCSRSGTGARSGPCGSRPSTGISCPPPAHH